MSNIYQRRLELLSVALLFYFPAILLTMLLIMAAFSLYLWPLIPFYLAWLYIDRKTPLTHGRSSTFVRRNLLWQYFRSYFPQNLVKTSDLDPTQNYILALFPHGIFSTAAFSHFFSETSDFFKLYPGIKVTPVTLSINFRLPLLREFFLAAGACSCDKDSILYRLNNKDGGQAVLLVPGGAAEALLTVQGAYRLVLKERKGFIKLAHLSGANVIPVFAFGETNAYSHVNFDKNSLGMRLQESVKNITGVAPCIAWGRSVLSKRFGLLPRRTPITTVVGRPIKMEKMEDPSDEVINASHESFIKELNNLFETYKEKYIENADTTRLVFE